MPEGQGIPLPGESPIPAGRVRRFHVTNADPETVRREGLLMSKARGIEGPKAIWSWTDAQSAKDYAAGRAPIVEFHADPKHFERDPLHQSTDVLPEHIVAIHEPWHDHFRSAVESGLGSDELRDIAQGMGGEHGKGYAKAAEHLERHVESEFYLALDAVDRHYDPDVDMHENWAWGDEADLQDLLGDLRERHPLHQLEAFYDPDTDAIHLDRVVVQKDHRKKGVGSAVMKALTDLADRKQKTMTLQTAVRSQSRDASPMTAGWGTTSRSRLVKFYGGHGFKENSSKRHYRPELMGDMNREPKPTKPRTRYSVDRHSEYAATAIHSNRTGQIFTGPMHVLAHNAAAEAGHEDAHNPYMWTDGFITHDGTFVDREEANARTGRKESVDLMASGHLPLASKEDASRATMSGPKEAQFRALHLKSELGDEERHFFDALDLIDRHNLFRSAAIKHRKTGRIYEGTWHEGARQAAADEYSVHGSDPWNTEDDFEDGFMTHDGKFLDRGEAEAATSDPGKRTHGDRESIGLMIKGHLPVDESLVDNDDVWKPLRTRLKEHIARKSGNV